MLSSLSFEKCGIASDDGVVASFDLVVQDIPNSTQSVVIYGWIQPRGAIPVKVEVRQGDHLDIFPADVVRPDVLEHFGGQALLNCGFQFNYEPRGVSPIRIYAVDSDNHSLIGSLDFEAAKSTGDEPSQAAIAPAQVSEKAVRGKNDFLFLGGDDSNGLIEHMSGKTAMSKGALNIHAHNFSIIDALTIPHLVLVVPEAHIVYEELLPDGLTVSHDRPITALLAQNGSSVWYPLDMMRELKAKGEVMYTGHDSHWSEFASLPVYDAMRRKLGRDFPAAATLTPSHAREVRDLRIVSREEVVAREEEARKIAQPASYRLYFSVGILNHGNITALFNPEGRDRLLAFGTSFSTRLVPSYACDFREVIFCYGTTIDPLLLDIVKPDAVVVEMPERFVHFPSRATRGSTLTSSLIAGRAPEWPGLMVDVPQVMPDPAALIDIARDLVMSGKEPSRLDDSLRNLGAYDPEVAARAANIVSILPQVSNPMALRAVISGFYMNGYAINTLWHAIDQGELKGARADIFPDTEMGLLARMRLHLRSGRPDATRELLPQYVEQYGKTEFFTRITEALSPPRR